MTLSYSVAAAIILCGLVLGLAGCSDGRLNGGYSGESMSHLQYVAPASAPASSDASYVYRGGRDPVSGEAAIRY